MSLVDDVKDVKHRGCTGEFPARKTKKNFLVRRTQPKSCAPAVPIGCPRFPCLRVVNSEFANHPSIFWCQRSTNSQIAKSDVLCPRCDTQICGFADVNKNEHSPPCAAAAATNLAAAPKKRRPRPRPRYGTILRRLLATSLATR